MFQRLQRQIVAALILLAFVALPVLAQDNFTLIPNDKYDGGAGCENLVKKILAEPEGKGPNTGVRHQFELYDIPCYATYLIEVLVYFAGGIAVLFVVIGGYQYMIGGITEDKEAGKKTLLYALGGFALAVLAWTIVNIVQVFLTS